jgi:hypothetical protein
VLSKFTLLLLLITGYIWRDSFVERAMSIL